MVDVNAAKTDNKSLSGKKLPQNWPQIISEEQEQETYQREITQPGKDVVIDKLSFTLKNGTKELCYLAVQHISGLENKDHPQFAALKRNFDEVKPQIVIYEGPLGNPSSMTEEQGYQYGEKGFVQYLVLAHNSKLKEGEKPIEMASGDIPEEVQIEEFKKLGYSEGDISNFMSRKNDFPAYKRMFSSEREFRDIYMIKQIVSALEKYDKVMVVMGSSHPIRQEEALWQYFS